MRAQEFITEIKKGQKDSNGYTRCWPGKHADGTKKGKNGGQVRNCVPNESAELNEFAPPGAGGGDSGRWYTDDELADIIGDDWFEDFDVSHDEFNIDAYGEKAKQNLASYANSWFDDKGYSVNVMGVDHNDVDHDLKWYIVGSFHNPNFADKDVDEGLTEEFDLIESIIEGIAAQNSVDAEAVWADLESLTEDELYAFAVTSQLNEDWQKANKRDKTDGMSQKAVNAYRRENPGSKLKTAVTTKPGKLKKGSKASKRRKSYCSRSRGQMKMHSISCAKTPDKAICKARRRWNC
jgi:hypothetical protein